MGTDWILWLCLGAATAATGAFLWALRRRWFARLAGGYSVALTVALVGAGLVTALTLGGWAYHESRQVVFREVFNDLDHVGGIAEAQLDADVRITAEKLAHVATPDMLDLARQDPDRARDELETLQRFNPRVLQINVVDADGAVVLSTHANTAAHEPVNRIGTAFAAEGESYVSAPYRSEAFGRYVLYLSVPIRADRAGRPVGVMSLRYDLESDLAALFAAARFGSSGHATLADHTGAVLSHAEGELVGQNIAGTAAFRAASAGGRGWVIAEGEGGRTWLYAYRPLKNPATLGGEPLVLLTEIDAAEALAPVATLRRGLLAGAAVLAVVWVLVARPVARHLTRPVADLVAAANRVRDGDLTARAEPAAARGRDEIAQFATAFDQMVHGLAERDRVKQIFGRYLTTQVSERLLKDGVNLAGERKQVTMLFADIRDFTTLSENMQPEQVVEMLNEYFSEMVDAVFEHGGVLDKFIGDGMLAVFGSLDALPDHRRRAVLTGLRMKARLAKINGEREMRGQAAIHIGIGIHTDEVVVGNIGSVKRMEYTVIGDGVNTCARVESMNKEFGTTLLVTEQTRAPLAAEFDCRPMPETPVKGKSRPVKVYEVLSARAASPAPAGPDTTAPLAA